MFFDQFGTCGALILSVRDERFESYRLNGRTHGIREKTNSIVLKEC
jgi:hypothetical protein